MKSNNGLMIYKKAILPICNRPILFSLLFVLLLIIIPIVYVCISYFSEIPFIITFLFSLLALLVIISLCYIPFISLKIKKNGKVILVTFFRISRYNINDLDKVYLSKNDVLSDRCFIKIRIVLKDKSTKYFDSSSQIKNNNRKLAKKVYSISKKEYQSFLNKTMGYEFIVFE